VSALNDAATLNARAAQMALDGNTLGATATAIAALGKLLEHLGAVIEDGNVHTEGAR
jgi:hypothetical protein